MSKAFVLVSPELKVGQNVTCGVDEVKNDGRIIRLSLSTPTQACAESEQGWNLTNLLPGLLVKATIKKVEKAFILVMSTSSLRGKQLHFSVTDMLLQSISHLQ